MTTQIAEKLYTIKEFLAIEWPEDDETEYELIGGRIVPRQGSTSARHSNIASRIDARISYFAGDNAGDKQTGYSFVGGSTNLGNPNGKNFTKPDVCFVSKDRLPADYNFDDELPVAPDLVVEVNSPSDTEERMHEKIEVYQEAGVKLIWSVHMLGKYVLVYRGKEPVPSLVTINDELDGEGVLPGFRLAVKDLFKK